MKIISLHIKNYKSITDSRVCFLEPDLTILAGKNESGKSSILEALRDFNVGSNIDADAIQIHNENAIPEIKITFEISMEEQIHYFKEVGVERILKEFYRFELTKSGVNTYSFSEHASEYFDFLFDPAGQKEGLFSALKSAYEVLEEFYNEYTSVSTMNFIGMDLDEENLISLKEDLAQYKEELEGFDFEGIDLDEVKKHEINLAVFEEKLEQLIDISSDVKGFRINLILNMIPNFILFKSFEDDIPNKVPFTELSGSEFIKDLRAISEFDVSILTHGNDRHQSNHKESLNIGFNKDYKEFWSQDNTSFEFDWHDKNLLVWIKENGQRYKPTERSKGKQWHLSFYLRVTARSKESKDNIILIDEPGMYLHAKAQSDIYKKLVEISNRTQTIFTTHSPYLLKYDEIDRIRLVNKTDGNSWINQKVHSGSDKETLTPLLTSIGLELSSEIHSIDRLNNVVVEGPSDFYYLQAIKIILELTDFNFVFGGGATKMPIVGTILSGWGCNVIYLFDNDFGKKHGEKVLKKDWFVNDEFIESVIQKTGSIEDLWSISFFKENVLNDPSLTYDKSNSQYVKEENIDKVLIAKKFLSKIRSEAVQIDEESMKRAKELVDRIRKKLAFDINSKA